MKTPIAGSARRMRENERGFNLVEVLVAMGLLGTVLVAIMSLFVMGRRNVYSGRQMTKAITVGDRILEDLAPLTKKDIYAASFAITDTASGGSHTILGTTYTNCKIRSTNATLIPSPPADIQSQTAGGPDFLTKWGTQMGTDLQNGSITLVLQPRVDNTNTPAQFATSQILRVRVIIQWTEASAASRRRSLILDTVKSF